MNQTQIFEALAISNDNSGVYTGEWRRGDGPSLDVTNPSSGDLIATVRQGDLAGYEASVVSARSAFSEWRMVPAPQRGEYVRRIGNALRDIKEPLGSLISLETGKIKVEGEGEVQEAIDIADFSVGLSRQLYGLTMTSERPRHRMYEQWHPLGPIGVITAFNFPAAVWAWNAMVAAVCGDTMIWKPSPISPLTAIAMTKVCHRVMEGTGFEGVFNLCLGRDRPGRERHGRGRSLASHFCHRLGADGCRGRCQGGRSVGAVSAGAWRQQRNHRDGGRRSGACGAWRCLRRGGNVGVNVAPACAG